ncbi:galactokinase [uncultured Amnibacterium sp.]|uniref:galactokinase n=1 Tax=uncultured Amnibacterium sp. TaxID=1631851 RepID=UPI0035CC317F
MNATELFSERFGRSPAGLWQAPGRVNLIGEHTDYNEGFVLPFAIDRSTTAALAPRHDRRVRVVTTFTDELVETSLDELAPESFGGWSAYPLGVAWAFGEYGAERDLLRGFDLSLDSDVPVGAGLSSSAAIEMTVAVALNEVWSLGFDRTTLARVGQRAENVAVGAPTGIMDQAASVFGRVDAAVLIDCRSLTVTAVPLGFRDAGLALLVVDTHVEHAHATGGYRERRDSCEDGARRLGVAALRDITVTDLDRARSELDDTTFRRVRHIVTENARVLDGVDALQANDLARFGALLYESHASMRDDFEISVPQLDLVVDVAARNDAVGARMTGGGFGGSAIALLPIDRADEVAERIASAFDEHGYDAPTSFVVTPSGGAGRVD